MSAQASDVSSASDSRKKETSFFTLNAINKLNCGFLLKRNIFNAIKLTFVLLKPSANRIISAIMAESGTTIDIGLNILFKLSGSSVRPA